MDNLTLSNPVVGTNSMAGTLGAGTGSIVLSTTTGNITVTGF